MFKLILIFFIGISAMSCINPQSHASNKKKTVQVMAEQIAKKFPVAPQLTIEEYLQWIKEKKKVVLVDVRPEKERKVSTLPGAISKEVFESNRKSYKDHQVVAYCTIGYRSSEYVRKLIKKNDKAYNLKEGLLGWAHRGQKFEIDGVSTTKAHVYEEAWNFLPKGYQGVTD